MTLQNAGQGPALHVTASIKGQIDESGGWDTGDPNLQPFFQSLPSDPLERLDPESQPEQREKPSPAGLLATDIFGGRCRLLVCHVKWMLTAEPD
jgi:hypothetical protein